VTLTAPEASLLVVPEAGAGLRVSICIPARNEASTVAGVVSPVVVALGGPDPLVDEVIVVDDCSTDGTGAIAEAFGARVVRRDGRPGKGSAMADALAVATGDIVVFLDADVRSFGLHYVTRLVEPLLLDDDVMLVKGTYRRPDNGGAGGGRVTELLARPLLRRLFPELAFVRQPLAGEVAVRRRALDGLALEPGYGVEIGMLIDVARRFGPSAIAQVDLGERVHRNRPLAELAGQADEVLAAVLSRSEAPRLAT
jgi:glucosyl-3-phosphoglycerate synthase